MTKKVNKTMTKAQILTKYGLNFKILKAPLTGTLEGTNKKLDTPYFGLFNSKTKECLSTVKAGYHVSQNDEVIEMVLKGMRGFGDLSVAKAGSLHGGRKVFVQLEIKGLSKLKDGDTIKRYVTVIDSNDGSTGLSVGIGDLTMSCQNQFFKFYKRGEAKFRHTAVLEEKIKSIPGLIEIALEASMHQVQVYNMLQESPVTKNLADKLVKELLGTDRVFTPVKERPVEGKALFNMKRLYDSIEDQMKGKGENLWGLFSGVTHWTTHNATGPNRKNGLIESQMLGTEYKKNQTAMDFVMRKSGILVAEDSMLAAQ